MSGGPASLRVARRDHDETMDGGVVELRLGERGGSGGRDRALRGRGTLAFTHRDAAGATTRVTSEAVHLSVARREEDGEWRIARRAWSRLR